MDLQRSNQLTPQKILKQQNGFAATVFLTILPALLAGLFFLLFSQYYLKNWTQSLYTCRSELLDTQAAVRKNLEQLMALNPEVRALRIAFHAAEVELAAATAAEDPAGIAEAERQIEQIKKQQRQIDARQKYYIQTSNLKMAGGVQKVIHLLRGQDQWNQSHMPNILSFRIRSISPKLALLAVKPDIPDVAPVYELKNDFTQEQELRVSWISEFQTQSGERFQWLSNHHKINQSCGASLKDQGNTFPEILHEGRPLSRL
jgi:hypothetical protein